MSSSYSTVLLIKPYFRLSQNIVNPPPLRLIIYYCFFRLQTDEINLCNSPINPTIYLRSVYCRLLPSVPTPSRWCCLIIVEKNFIKLISNYSGSENLNFELYKINEDIFCLFLHSLV